MDPIWPLATSVAVSAFCVLSREALEEFSFSDAEEHLRKTGNSKRDLPRLERVANRIREYQFDLRILDYAGRAVAMVLLWDMLGASWESGALLLFVIGWMVHISVLDLVLRPLAAARPEQLTLWLLRPWHLLSILLYLPFLPMRLILMAMRRLLEGEQEEDAESQAEDDILAAVSQGEYSGHIDEEERDMIESVLGLGALTVDKVMTPRTEMRAVDVEDGCAGALAEAQESGHSRLPVYEDNRDNVIGICYVKDLLGTDPEELPPLAEVLRKPLLVPASKNVAELMRDLRRDRVHLAIVLDEYGGTAGLITFEDIIEEVFGDIDDEYDEVSEEEVTNLDEDTADLDAKIHVDEVNERFSVNLPEDERYESLGGLLTCELGHIPETGAEWANERIRLTVLEATDRRIVRVRLEIIEEDAADN